MLTVLLFLLGLVFGCLAQLIVGAYDLRRGQIVAVYVAPVLLLIGLGYSVQRAIA